MAWPIIAGRNRECPFQWSSPSNKSSIVQLTCLGIPTCSVAICDENCPETQLHQLSFGYRWWGDVTSLQDLDPSLCWLPYSRLSWASWDRKDNSNQGSPFIDWWGATYNIHKYIDYCFSVSISYRFTVLSYVCQGYECLLPRKSGNILSAFRNRWSTTIEKWVCTWHQWSYCRLVQWLQNSKPPQRLPQT